MYATRTILIITLSFLAGFGSYAQKKTSGDASSKVQQYERLLNLVYSDQYRFVAEWAIPQRGRQVNLMTRPNYLTVKGDSAAADLPYFGRLLTGGYGTGGGISFNGPVEGYGVQKNDKKHRLVVKMRIRGTNDNYKCRLTISGPENASLSVISNNRQQIRYTGSISAIGQDL